MRSSDLLDSSVLLVKLMKGGKQRIRGVEGRAGRPGIPDGVHSKLSSNVPCQCSELYGQLYANKTGQDIHAMFVMNSGETQYVIVYRMKYEVDTYCIKHEVVYRLLHVV